MIPHGWRDSALAVLRLFRFTCRVAYARNGAEVQRLARLCGHASFGQRVTGEVRQPIPAQRCIVYPHHFTVIVIGEALNLRLAVRVVAHNARDSCHVVLVISSPARMARTCASKGAAW